MSFAIVNITASRFLASWLSWDFVLYPFFNFNPSFVPSVGAANKGAKMFLSLYYTTIILFHFLFWLCSFYGFNIYFYDRLILSLWQISLLIFYYYYAHFSKSPQGQYWSRYDYYECAVNVILVTLCLNTICHDGRWDDMSWVLLLRLCWWKWHMYKTTTT